MPTLAARWVFPGTAPPIADGRLRIDDAGRIAGVGSARDLSGPVDVDIGDAAIVPGFVNAHTHLELAPIAWDESGGPEDEIAWLGRVIRARSDRSVAATADLIGRNLAEALASGTTTLADITTAGASWGAVAAAPVWGTVFGEVLGLSEARGDQTWAAAMAWLDALPARHPDDRTRPGLSPHAPYSTAGRLYDRARRTGLPLATHLGEMPAERPFLAHRTGPLRRFVTDLGAWTDEWQPIGPTPTDYILPDCDLIIAHGNIFDPGEDARLVADRDDPTARRLAVAYCPRTHARFGHPPHPFRRMLDAGVVVCLGTDSRASAPSLSILDEIRFLRQHHRDVSGATLLAMATIHGAWALRRDHQTGSLAPGKSADLVVVPIDPDRTAADPHDLILDHDAPPRATVFGGRVVFGRLD